jgi:hypothetical protein
VSAICTLCNKRKAKRACPALGADICPSCCGEARENTLDCPLECEYLQEARLHEKPNRLDPATTPNTDIQLTEKFLEEQEPVLILLSLTLRSAMQAERAVDADAREAIAGLIQTYRTLESGLIYESRPQNPYAARIQDELKRAIEDVRKRIVEKTGMHGLRDSEVLGCLVFLQRLELEYNNGRKRSRAFLDFLRTFLPATSASGLADSGTAASTVLS